MNIKRILVLFLLFASPVAIARNARVINAQSAAADYTPTVYVDATETTTGSFQCTWASLTGTLDGQFIVKVSNDGGTTWTTKSGGTITVSGASGNDSISLNGTMSELLYRIQWVHNNVSGGTVNCYSALKTMKG